MFAIFDFIAFVAIALAPGGAAVWGKVESGRLFLGMYGCHTEVSERVFTSSKWHGYSVFAARAVLVLAGVAAKVRGEEPAEPE